MKILVTGSSGQLGKTIVENKKSKNFFLLTPNRSDLDLSYEYQCINYIERNKPDFIINCGAFTNVDEAEDSYELAYKINTKAPLSMAKVIQNTGCRFLQISTDYVFDGRKNTPYKTNDPRNPISKYGETKAYAEIGLESILSKSQLLILRTSWIVSNIGKNFLLSMIKLHEIEKELNVVYDQIGAITSTQSLADLCLELIENWDNVYPKTNTLHWTSLGVSSWYDVASAIGEIAQNLGVNSNKAIINPIRSEKYITKALRPKYSILDIEKTLELVNLKPLYWREEIKNIISTMRYSI